MHRRHVDWTVLDTRVYCFRSFIGILPQKISLTRPEPFLKGRLNTKLTPAEMSVIDMSKADS